jgi:1,4-alpha-glucan branching enzyme
VSPIGFALAAACLVLIGVAAGRKTSDRRPVNSTVVAATQTLRATDSVLQSGKVVQVFVLSAPDAKRVSLVGDFNNWSLSATPMVRAVGGGLWTVTVPLSAGRHEYNFVVSQDGGIEWRVDPRAPLSPDDGLGHPNSVIVVRGAATS